MSYPDLVCRVHWIGAQRVMSTSPVRPAPERDRDTVTERQRRKSPRKQINNTPLLGLVQGPGKVARDLFLLVCGRAVLVLGTNLGAC